MQQSNLTIMPFCSHQINRAWPFLIHDAFFKGGIRWKPLNLWGICFLAVLAFAMSPAPSVAGIIPIQVGGAGGTGSIVVAPPGVIEFNVNKTFTSLAPIDISFNVTPGRNPLDLFDISERIVNSTGKSWFDFHMELGTGTGDNFRAIAASTNLLFTFAPVGSECSSPHPNFNVGLGPDCGLTPFGGSASGTTVLNFLSTSPDITAQNASAIENGHQFNVAFQFQVPQTGLTNFTLRQIPTTDGKALPPSRVPEPGTLSLVGLCGLVLAFARRSPRASLKKDALSN